MAQNELLVDVLRRDLGFLQMTIADMSDAELAQRPAPAANTILWQLGHLIGAEAFLTNASAGKTVVELPAGFVEKYSKATVGENDPVKLGKKDELMALFVKAREKTCEWLATQSAADLAKPALENMRKVCPTVGHLMYMYSSHLGMHLGQIQVLRRKLGKPVLF